MAKRRKTGADDGWQRFAAEAAYAESIVALGMGDAEGSVAALRRSLDALPSYAPAILSMGSVEYQLDRAADGRCLFLSLLKLPDETEDLTEIIDQAGDFLIGIGAYADGLELYQGAVARFPDVTSLLQGLSCCAGREGAYAEAVAAAEAALALEPDRQECVVDVGWSLYLAGELEKARSVLEQAVAMDPGDELAAENLRICERALRARAA